MYINREAAEEYGAVIYSNVPCKLLKNNKDDILYMYSEQSNSFVYCVNNSELPGSLLGVSPDTEGRAIFCYEYTLLSYQRGAKFIKIEIYSSVNKLHIINSSCWFYILFKL